MEEEIKDLRSGKDLEECKHWEGQLENEIMFWRLKGVR